MQRILGMFAILLLSSLTTAQSKKQGDSCLFEFERGVVPDCILVDAAGKLFVAPQYVTQLTFDSSGLAPIRSETPLYGWMYVNRGGNIVITGVPTVDNWADEFHEGLVRTVKNGKVGFTNSEGKIVIPPTYDWAWPFEKGVAEVCNGCHEECSGQACEYRTMVGGKRFHINRNGKVVRADHDD